jgi:hypothetical protein
MFFLGRLRGGKEVWIAAGLTALAMTEVWGSNVVAGVWFIVTSVQQQKYSPRQGGETPSLRGAKRRGNPEDNNCVQKQALYAKKGGMNVKGERSPPAKAVPIGK